MKTKIARLFSALKWKIYEFSVSLHQKLDKKFPKRSEKKKSMSGPRRMRVLFLLVMFLYPVTQFIIFWVIPNIDAVILAFTKYDRVNKQTIFTFYQFGRVFDFLKDSNSYLSRSLLNSLAYFITQNVIGLPITLMLSYFLYKKVLGHKVFRVVFFLPSIISGVVLATLFSNFLNPFFGPFNRMLSLISGKPMTEIPNFLGDPQYKLYTICAYTLWTGFGVNLVMISGAIARLPAEVIEYGKIEGVGMTRELVSLIVPMIMPTLTTIIELGVAAYFTFLQPVMLLDPIGASGLSGASSVGYYIYYLFKGQMNSNFELASAVGVFCAAIGVPIIVLVRKGLAKCVEAVEY